MMVEGTVEVQGTVKVDDSSIVEKSLQNARRAREKEDWEEVEKYYNLVEQSNPKNIEAVFFSAYGKAMLSLTESDFFRREQKFNVLNKSISVISEYYEEMGQDKEALLAQICDAILKLDSAKYVYDSKKSPFSVDAGSFNWHYNLIVKTEEVFIAELKEIAQKDEGTDVGTLIERITANTRYGKVEELRKKRENEKENGGGCYVATAVYGSYDCPQVWTLRRFRDNTLAESRYGRAFIRTYYAVSPTLVKWFGDTAWFKRMWKRNLDRVVANLNARGVEDTPYQDKAWK